MNSTESAPDVHWTARIGGVAGRPPKRTWLLLIVLFLGAVSIRVIGLDERSLWVDEGATAVLASLPFEDIAAAGSEVKHPPGYYTLIHFTSKVSDSETGLRLPSVLASSMAALFTYLVGRRLVDHRVGLLAAAILILSPLDVWYAQEARQPVLAALAVIAATWGLTRGGKFGLLASAAALVLGLFLDYITAVGWAAIGGLWLVLSLRSDPRKFLDWILVTALAALVFAPFEGPGFVTGFQVLLGDQGAGIWYGAVLGSNPVTSNPFGLLTLGMGLTAGIAAIGDLLTRSERGGAWWATIIVAGFALGSALTPIPRAYSVKKIIVVGWPLLALIVAYLIVDRITKGVRGKVVISVLVLSAVASFASFLVPKDDWRAATAYVNANANAADAVWVGPDPWAADAYHYYAGVLPVFHDPEPGGQLAEIDEVWLITYRRPQDTPPALDVEEWFDVNWELVDENPFYRLAVRRYTR